MSKIVTAANAMIVNHHKISPALLGQRGEVFFVYDGKFNWSMKRDKDDFYLWFYPGDTSIETLSHYENDDWEGVPMVTYKLSDLGTEEAEETFQELYGIVKEKIYGVDKVLDEIIRDME